MSGERERERERDQRAGERGEEAREYACRTEKEEKGQLS
jgi:hypothetical protein